MQVHKPKVEYKLALQEKPQGSIMTFYYKTNNLTRINWLNTRLIIASNKIRHEIPFTTKRVKYKAIWKKSIKIVKPRFPPQFFLFHPPQFYLFSLLILKIPPPQLKYFPSIFFIPSTTILIFSLNFTIFPPQCYYSLLHNFIIFPPPPPLPSHQIPRIKSLWHPG